MVQKLHLKPLQRFNKAATGGGPNATVNPVGPATCEHKQYHAPTTNSIFRGVDRQIARGPSLCFVAFIYCHAGKSLSCILCVAFCFLLAAFCLLLAHRVRFAPLLTLYGRWDLLVCAATMNPTMNLRKHHDDR